ncbi:MAG: hypothetical protein A2Z20_00910 [Bdellovibrionales bacterium RBG_16_40_8]|nr:MAG: hypothetical protein A2Z20_00910 [Bdellovibrionales bacterium RBG_16_40_8]
MKNVLGKKYPFGELISLAVMSFIAMGCGRGFETNVIAPHTGNELFEQEVAPYDTTPEEIKSLENIIKSDLAYEIKSVPPHTYYVYSTRLNIRSEPQIRDENIVGALNLNDEVQVIGIVSDTVFVEVQILKTVAKLKSASTYFVAKDYLSINRNEVLQDSSRNNYFLVQNIATEKLRIYKKLCDDGRCAHKMVFESDVVVGEKTRNQSTMTVLGSFNIIKWVKFYEDGGQKYPSWYDPNYPKVPEVGAGLFSWTSSEALPYRGSKVRGAFGWYTAHVGPNSYYQWTHGTIGWGADKTKYIDITRGFFSNLFSDPRSHGCTRTDNESIAYIRHILDAGAPLIKIYAIEKLYDPNLLNYQEKNKKWDYILTKNGVRIDGEKADREKVLQAGTPRSQWLEEGSYAVDLLPDVKSFKPGGSGAKRGKNGNVYGLKDKDMRGVYFIDEGRVLNYSHPDKLPVGGYGRNILPEYMVAKDVNQFVD